MTGSYLGTGVTRGDAPSVRISGVTRGDDGLQARFGFCHSHILEAPTTEPEFKARVGCRVLLSYAALADLLMNEKGLRAISGPDSFGGVPATTSTRFCAGRSPPTSRSSSRPSSISRSM